MDFNQWLLERLKLFEKNGPAQLKKIQLKNMPQMFHILQQVWITI